MGYFEECGGKDNPYPVIGIEVGTSYKFFQEDRSNYYHPLGFAYHPSGSHEDQKVVEEEFVTYRVDRDKIGLAVYKEDFFHSPGEWTRYGTFSVELEYDKDYHADLFYFSHIHKNMAGRVKLLNNGTPIHPTNIPAIDYIHPKPSAFDEDCGTYGLSPFQLPHAECPREFICDKQSRFGQCVDTMNCFMMVGMTTYAEEQGDVALFKHHMIPHHKNAVNMAKALLKTGVLDCESLDHDQVNEDCAMENILREIVNNQIYQIQIMYDVLKDGGSPTTNDCVVEIGSNEQ